MSIYPKSLDFASVSACSDSTLAFQIQNTGCDTLWLNNAGLAGDVSFTLLSQVPKYLAKDSSFLLPIRFSPPTKGLHTATVTVQWDSNGYTEAASHAITGIGLPGSRLVGATPSSIDFGQIYACESGDTTIVLTNTGCDTLHVTGGSFSNPSLTSSSLYPDTVPPGGSLTINIHVDTSHSNAAPTISGSYSPQSDAQNSIPAIPIELQVIPAVHLVLEIEPSQSGSNGGTVTYLVRVVGPHPPKLFSTFYFDLIHNDDLLSFDTAIGDGLSVTSDPQINGMMTQHFALAPVPLTDTVGRLVFTAYLSRVDSTALVPVKFSFRNALSLSPDCIATLDDSGSSFTYIPSCSDDLLQALLRSEQIKIDRIVPNPAREIVRVKGSEFGVSDIQVYDVMGRRMSVPVNITPQPHALAEEVEFGLDVRGLAEGMYYMQVGNARGRFVIER
jgi:hypothetical protein